jgi:hypothetical protein
MATNNLGRCDFRQYEHCGPHERIPDVGQRLPPFGCKNWNALSDDVVDDKFVPFDESPQRDPDHLNPAKGGNRADNDYWSEPQWVKN